MRTAFAPKSRGSLNSALRSFHQFAEACPARELVKEPRWLGDRAASSWNEWTLILFAMYLATTPSKRTGRPVSAKTVETYISLVKGFLSFNFDFDLVNRIPRLKRLLMDLQSERVGVTSRKKRRGVRRSHLIQMWGSLPHVRSTDADSVNNHALLSVAWHTLARGGELAPQAKVWDADLHPSRADLKFGRTSSGRRYAILSLRPLKKKATAHQVKVPQFITEFDGGGSDTYAALRRLVKFDPVPRDERATTPLFRRTSAAGPPAHITVAQMRGLVKARMAELGHTVSADWGAHSCRIGGATDLVATGRASPLLLQAKGRWSCDIGRIYARMTRRSQLAASDLMQEGRGRDLEELLGDFVQPAL